MLAADLRAVGASATLHESDYERLLISFGNGRHAGSEGS